MQKTNKGKVAISTEKLREQNSPVELRNKSPLRVRPYRILSPRMAFCSVNVIKLTYFNVFLFSAICQHRTHNREGNKIENE